MIDLGPPAVNGAPNRSEPGRAHVPGLATAHPLGGFLPALFQEDDFTQRWTAGLDGVLAPVFSSLDNFEAYIDPLLTPPDFLDWLGSWMGLVADETWPVQRRRAFVSQASALYRMRGTPRGLVEHVRLFTDGEVEIIEHGAVAVSTAAGAALPGSPGFDFTVRVTVEDPSTVDSARLDALVAAAKPAHLAHRVEVIGKSQPKARPARRAPAASAAPEEVPSAEASAEAPPEPPSVPPVDGSESPPTGESPASE